MILSDKDKKMYFDRALKGADWFVRTQLGQWRALTHLGDNKLVYDNQYFRSEHFEGERDPNKDWSTDRGIAFNSDRGRFLYYYYMPEKKYVPGLDWTQGRALFVLTDAYKATGDERYLETARFGAKYIQGLQVTDPYYSKGLGAIRELTPVGSACGILDGAQAASGLVMLEQVSKEDNWLRLGRMFGDFILRHWESEGLPLHVFLWPEERVDITKKCEQCMQYCSVIPLWHLYRRTSEKKYLKPVLWAADEILEMQRPEGDFWCWRTRDPDNPPLPSHHQGIGEGEEKFRLRNDDGMVLLLLAAYEATRESRYLDACVSYADLIVSEIPEERPYCVFPVKANNVLDIGRAAGKDYSEWVLDNLKERVLDLQVLDSGDAMADGGFRGEDEQGEGGVFGGRSLDYVVTRVTCYSAGTLFRLSEQGTGSGFSVWGLG